MALTHSSGAHTRGESNERMEFLGDAVLGLVICELLYRQYEDFHEGEMTKIKSAVVSRRTCAEVSDELGITQLLFLGKGIEAHTLPDSVAAAVLESLIGAVYLDGGIEPAGAFIHRTMEPKVRAIVANQLAHNYKSALQQYAQRQWNLTPIYELLDEKGPDHARAFEVGVVIGGQRFPTAWANTKKQAEQLAAQAALVQLGVVEAPESV